MGQVLLNTHHFIARYFLQTGWLRSSMRLYCTIACRRCNRIMTHSQYTQHILHKQWYSLQNQRGCAGNSPAPPLCCLGLGRRQWETRLLTLTVLYWQQVIDGLTNDNISRSKLVLYFFKTFTERCCNFPNSAKLSRKEGVAAVRRTGGKIAQCILASVICHKLLLGLGRLGHSPNLWTFACRLNPAWTTLCWQFR